MGKVISSETQVLMRVAQLHCVWQLCGQLGTRKHIWLYPGDFQVRGLAADFMQSRQLYVCTSVLEQGRLSQLFLSSQILEKAVFSEHVSKKWDNRCCPNSLQNWEK